MLLARRGDLDELRARADAGDEARRPGAGHAAGRARRPGRGGTDLRARADAGDEAAARLLASRGDLDRAVQITRAWFEAGIDDGDTVRVILMLAPRGNPRSRRRKRDDLYQLRARADLEEAGWTLKAGQGDRADAGNEYAAFELAVQLAERGDVDGLRALAAVNRYAATRLAVLLAERGDVDDLRALAAAAGDKEVGWVAADLLTKQGRGEEAERLRWFGLNPDGSIACA